MSNSIHIVGISGSLRAGSYNSALLRSVQSLLPDQTTFEIAEIGTLPFYNSDLDGDSRPDAVANFRTTLGHADAFVIATPEYNYSIPGVLKNSIDWASRGKDSPLLNKPVGVMGATNGMWGTVRMQQSIRPILQAMNMYPVNRPEVFVSQARTKFDDNGILTDEKTKDVIRQHLSALRHLTITLKHQGNGHGNIQ